jgi:2-methylisocitrate lyase-like PEP mutase family enzyme
VAVSAALDARRRALLNINGSIGMTYDRANLRARLGENAPLLVPGAPNALTARLLETCGFEAVYVTGAGVTNTYLGVPDIGLLTLTELAGHVAAMREAISVPLIVDADAGFGNPLGVRRTVRLLERAGANAIQLEDQVEPKRCGHFTGKSVISADEMVHKIHAALDARTSEDLLIIARTDARGVTGLDDACERANCYAQAGADVIFVEAPRSEQELAEIPRRVPGTHMVNMVEGGLTPILPEYRLAELGFSIVLYANTAMRAAITGMREVMSHLRVAGDTIAVTDRLASWDERQSLVGKEFFDRLSETYGDSA